MKVLSLIVITLILVSCGPRRPGKLGAKGEDGYSLVVDVNTQVAQDGTICKRTDIFQDLDRNNFYSTEDRYQNGFLVCDGTAGTNGINANVNYQVVDIIDPCGPQHPNGYDEVILKLGNGKYLASFSDNANGLNTRFGVLPSGNYSTTDGTGCIFNIP